MVFGMTIIGAFILFLCVTLYSIVERTDVEVEETERTDVKEKNEDDGHNTFVVVFLVLIVAFSIIFGVMIYSYASRDAVAEANGPVETIAETVAPTIDILPTVEPTYIEETVVVTEPTNTVVAETRKPVAEANPESVVDSTTTTPTNPVTTNEPMSDVEMLACVIYQEAGGNGSCDNCRRYVADIVLNRVNDPRFPNNIHDVLTAESQYGRFHWTGIKWAERAKYETEKEAVARAYRVAEEVLAGNHSELYGNGYIWQAGFVQGTDGFWCCGHFYGR